MAAKAVRIHGQPACTVDVSPSEVDAGTDLNVTVRASCPHGCNLRAHGVSIRNQDETELARAELAAFKDGAYVTSALALRAPLEAGGHVYRAVLPAHEKDGILHQETSAEFSFRAKAHATSVNVWGLPSTIAAGEPFSLNVGIKCSAGCNLAGSSFTVFDHEGAQAGAGNLLADVWTGTSALYFAPIEVQAPLAVGAHEWQVETSESDSGVSHAVGSVTFRVNVVSAPDHEVTVEVFDSERQTPIDGMHVLLHPYRSRTDEAGVAKVKVARGRYKLYVSGFNYIPYEGNIDVDGDMTTRVELAPEPEGQEDYR